jgi:hypothetical protein
VASAHTAETFSEESDTTILVIVEVVALTSTFAASELEMAEATWFYVAVYASQTTAEAGA